MGRQGLIEAVACRDRDHPSWKNAKGMVALGFISATLGLQVSLSMTSVGEIKLIVGTVRESSEKSAHSPSV